MNVSAGIVGLPNVGKSTLFNTLSSAEAESNNYPFCTIDPNVGIIPVPDPRLEVLRPHFETDEVVPASVEIHDIAGLVEGASEGEGLGNAFLSNIRETDALVHVVRCFEDDDVAHVEGSVDPVRDIDIVETELLLADLETVESRLETLREAADLGDESAEEEVESFERAKAALDDGRPVRSLEFESDEERRHLEEAHLLTMKPVLYVANVGESGLHDPSEHVEALREEADRRGSDVLELCASLEAELAELDDASQETMLREMGLEEPALNALVRETYDLLGLRSFYTAGPKEIRAWTIPAGATAAEAGGTIHSQIEDHFIRAEVYSVDDLRRHGSEAAIREAGDVRLEGSDYVVQDGDVIFFRHNA